MYFQLKAFMYTIILVFCFTLPCNVSAEDVSEPLKPANNGEGRQISSSTTDNSRSHLNQVIAIVSEGFGYTFKTLAYGVTHKPSDFDLNPNNDFLQIPHYTAGVELRPDFTFSFKNLNLVVKPRLLADWSKWEDGAMEGESDTDDDIHINEWLARLRLFNGMYLSYGRENLQWGPSYFISPSNPFFRDNGQANPKQEVAGQDFARLIWVFNPSWTCSLIANTDEGRQNYIHGFDPAYALKIDFTGYRKYFSLIGSVREHEKIRFGAFAGWTVTDASLIYAEAGDIGHGTEALYPYTVEDPSVPYGFIGMRPDKEDANQLEGTFLIGTSYTLYSGPTLTAEYIFNSPGYNDEQADLYYQMLGQASESFFMPEPVASVAKYTLSYALDPKLRLLRRNYLMIQYLHTNIRDDLNLTLRYVYNIDDNSSRAHAIVEYDVGDRSQLFFIGGHNFGSDNAEFTMIEDYSCMAGVEFTF